LMEQLASKRWDVVLVNIVADVIIGLAPILPGFLADNTTLICSGILDTRLQDVVSALENAGIRITQVREKEDWRCVAGVRKQNT
ncbi:MAG: 50S ribosomal protein L11 methyltransferase, partial [Faecousia sp.]